MESTKRVSRAETKARNAKHMAPKRENIMDHLKRNYLYDTKEACELLGVSTQSLRRAIAISKIKTVRLGRYLRIPVTEIAKLSQGEVALITCQEAADLLNVPISMIRRLIKAEKIKAFKLAKKGPYKIPKSEIDRIAREGITQ